MKKISAKILSPIAIDQLVSVFQEHIHERIGLSYVLKKKPVLIGKIKSNFFKLTTVDSPPMTLEGSINEINNEALIEILIKADSMKPAFLGLILGITYPIVFVVFLITVINDPTNFWIYFWTLISIPSLYFFAKIYSYLNYHEPDPDFLLDQLSKVANGKIIEKVNLP